MRRKEFIKTTVAFAAATALNPLTSCKKEKKKTVVEIESKFVRKNWAGNYTYQAKNLHEPIGPQLMITEIRTIAADNLWMSPCYKQDCVAIHFTWKQNAKEVGELITMIENELEPFGYRPHWGKLFSMDPTVLASRYEKLPQFINLAKQFDSKGKFKNNYLNRNIYS